jgi:hypothetical protein
MPESAPRICNVPLGMFFAGIPFLSDLLRWNREFADIFRGKWQNIFVHAETVLLRRRHFPCRISQIAAFALLQNSQWFGSHDVAA